MNKELTEKLYNHFPELYWQHDLDMKKTAMFWGFDVGDGWFDLLYELSEKLQPLVNDINNKYEQFTFAVVQVKEKFGGLRFYVNGASDEINDLIDEYEKKSYLTCEVC